MKTARDSEESRSRSLSSHSKYRPSTYLPSILPPSRVNYIPARGVYGKFASLYAIDLRIIIHETKKPQPSAESQGEPQIQNRHPHLPAKACRGDDAGRSPGSSHFKLVFPSRLQRDSDSRLLKTTFLHDIINEGSGITVAGQLPVLTEFPPDPGSVGIRTCIYPGPTDIGIRTFYGKELKLNVS